MEGAPRKAEDISAVWLTQVLAQNFPGVAVTSATVGTILHAAATKLHLLVTYNEAGHRARLPPTMWLKTRYKPHRAIPEIAALYRSEAFFYRDFAGKFDLGCPKADAIHIGADDASLRRSKFGRGIFPVPSPCAL